MGVLRVNSQVKTHQLSERFVVIAQHASEVSGPIEFWVNGSDAFAITVRVAEDGGSNNWKLGNQIHAVFVGVFPVLAFVDTLITKER